MRSIRYLLVLILAVQTQFSVGQNGRYTPPQKVEDTMFDYLSYTDSIVTDSQSILPLSRRNFTLVDTLSNDTILNLVFKPYLSIRNVWTSHAYLKKKRTMPTIKEIKIRPVESHVWEFWTIILILLYVSFVRIMNPNNFKAFLVSVFNLKLSEKIWEDQRSLFGFVILQMFAIYLLIASLFVSKLPGIKHLIPFPGIAQPIMIILPAMFLLYLGKFILHAFFGYILKMKNLAIGFVSNTISVNNFIALVILPFLVFLLFNSDALVRLILTQTIVTTFFLSVIYRMVRIVLLSNSFFTFPKIYLFIYLCAFEILPWFVFLKFINGFQI